ncbi:magnetosome biogenesis transporter MamN [Magnetovibrio sp. PR-2]|uniref:magnetosome biogenesis transporter MamN n=1 Tax=Magnetovibrio sp. PR-2 TaxID=3120356 RepID=UPI002FCDF3C7
MQATVATAIFGTVIGVIYFNQLNRHAAVLLGAGAMVLVGMVAGFFSLQMALQSIYFETLALIFGMSAISSVLERSGLFALIAQRTARSAYGNGWWVLVVFALATYGLSLLVNNLAAITVIVPVTLSVCLRMKINPVPMLIVEIVASNLGGASTMIGDFPNMIIASAGQLGFTDFLGGMMVPCLVLLAVMLMFVQHNRDKFGLSLDSMKRKDDIGDATDGGTTDIVVLDTSLLRIGLSLMATALLGFLLSDALDLRPGWVAITAGAVAVILSDLNQDKNWFQECGGLDILFFAALFIMVGGLVAAGVLDGVFSLISTLSGGESTSMMLMLMWLAAFFTMFMNAGATTAMFVPVTAGLDATIADTTVWWALSLGVLAGSSAALTGATAGPLTSSYLDRFLKSHPETEDLIPHGQGLSFKSYLSWGLPLMGLFLLLSSFYILIVAR